MKGEKSLEMDIGGSALKYPAMDNCHHRKVWGPMGDRVAGICRMHELPRKICMQSCFNCLLLIGYDACDAVNLGWRRRGITRARIVSNTRACIIRDVDPQRHAAFIADIARLAAAYKAQTVPHSWLLSSPISPEQETLIMSASTVPYPFHFDSNSVAGSQDGSNQTVNLTLQNVRGKIPSIQASRLRTMMLEARRDPTKILAHACTYDGLSSRLVEEAGFPMVFLAGYAVSSSYGLPDAGYIAMAELCDKIQEAYRQVSVPIMADGDTGYGSPMNVKRTVESFAAAGAAGVMIEDQQWPKRKRRYHDKAPPHNKWN